MTDDAPEPAPEPRAPEPPAAAAPEPAPARGAGRPRDASIDERVLDVTRELLVEVGWDELSIRMVAARVGVGRASISRRWASKAELVLHAVLGAEPDLAPFEGTDLEGWIAWVVRGSHELFHRTDMRAAVPGLLTALRENDALREALWRGFAGPAAQLYAERTGAGAAGGGESGSGGAGSGGAGSGATDPGATDPGATDPGLDARAVIAMAAGAALFTSMVATEDDSPALQARIAGMLTDAVRAGRR